MNDSSAREPVPVDTPIYPVFTSHDAIGAAVTGKGTDRENYYFSFQRSGIAPSVLAWNIAAYAEILAFDRSKVTWPNGSWPHSGQVIVAEHHDWVPPSRSPAPGYGIVPLDKITGEPVTYDGIATASPDFVLGVQGADCPSLLLYDPVAKVVGAAHSGWKPTVRGVVRGTVRAMASLGASPERILAYVSPGVGDRYNEFSWDEAMEDRVRDVFTRAGRTDLLVDDPRVRYKMTLEDRAKVQEATGRAPRGGVCFKLSALIAEELKSEGVPESNIEVSEESTICERYPEVDGVRSSHFRYHSARRDDGKDPERPGFGSSLCVIFLKSPPPEYI